MSGAVTIKYSSLRSEPRQGDYKNQVVIYRDNWNDYSYRTTFHMVFCDKTGAVNIIGDVKIYYWDFDRSRNPEHYDTAVSTTFMGNTVHLDEKYCSLGQSLQYYGRLKKYCPEFYMDILSILRDIAVFPEIRDKFINEDGVQTSLLRESSAEKALKEAAEFLQTEELIEKDLSFTYYASVPYMGRMNKTLLSFDFKKQNYLPYRINAVVGKNGTGKTQILTALANGLSGYSDAREGSRFKDGRPAFDKVISISYSAFDSFKKVARKYDTTLNSGDDPDYGLKSYVYCGIQSESGTLSLDDLRDNFKKAFQQVKDKERFGSWEGVMSEVMEPEHVELIKRINDGRFEDIHWSSGQHILVCTLTEVLANIEKESIILFDEPELHLHPNAIANTMRMINRLLEEFDSYAIIATHSPIIIQEIPSRYIQIFQREKDIFTVRKPNIECFGENVTQITNEIFDVKSTESNYRSYLSKAIDAMSYDEVLRLYNDNLSFNALLYLKACEKRKSGD